MNSQTSNYWAARRQIEEPEKQTLTIYSIPNKSILIFLGQFFLLQIATDPPPSSCMHAIELCIQCPMIETTLLQCKHQIRVVTEPGSKMLRL
jgi:hypothetical protein